MFEIIDIQATGPVMKVIGVGGAGGNAINHMIETGVQGVEFIAVNTDAQVLSRNKARNQLQLGSSGLGAGARPEEARAAALSERDRIEEAVAGSHMVFITAGMGGGTGTGAAPVVARAAREQGILTVGVVTKPFGFEGTRRMRLADDGIDELHRHVDTLIVIPNQNLFRIANERTTFADAFRMADQVLHQGVSCVTDLMVKEGLINLDFADVRAVMRGMGKAMMGTGEASGEDVGDVLARRRVQEHVARQAAVPPLVLVLDVGRVGPLHDAPRQRVLARPQPIRQVELGCEMRVLTDAELIAVEAHEEDAFGGAHMEDDAPPRPFRGDLEVALVDLRLRVGLGGELRRRRVATLLDLRRLDRAPALLAGAGSYRAKPGSAVASRL